MLEFWMDLTGSVAEYGPCFYLLTFLWTFLEGETFVLVAGFAASQGLVDPLLLLTAAWLGSFCGDQFYFAIGRHFGERLFRRFPKWRCGVDGALVWLKRPSASLAPGTSSVPNSAAYSISWCTKPGSASRSASRLPWPRSCSFGIGATGAVPSRSARRVASTDTAPFLLI
jgi:hypothetical protein